MAPKIWIKYGDAGFGMMNKFCHWSLSGFVLENEIKNLGF
jgi:hypothetical protein